MKAQTKTDQARALYLTGNLKGCLRVLKGFKLGFSPEESRTIQIAYECLTTAKKVYVQMGIDTEQIGMDAIVIIESKLVPTLKPIDMTTTAKNARIEAERISLEAMNHTELRRVAVIECKGRKFAHPTKDDLIAAILEERTQHIEAQITSQNVANQLNSIEGEEDAIATQQRMLNALKGNAKGKAKGKKVFISPEVGGDGVSDQTTTPPDKPKDEKKEAAPRAVKAGLFDPKDWFNGAFMISRTGHTTFKILEKEFEGKVLILTVQAHSQRIETVVPEKWIKVKKLEDKDIPADFPVNFSKDTAVAMLAEGKVKVV